MKKLFFVIGFVFISVGVNAQQKILQRIYNNAQLSMINIDSSHYLAYGMWASQFGLPYGLLAEFDSVGNILWRKQYSDSSGNDNRFSKAIVLNNGNYLVSAYTAIGGNGFNDYSSNALFDPQGNFIAAKKYAAANNLFFFEIYENPDGTLLACGDMKIIGGMINAPTVGIIAKFDASLNIIWAKQYQRRYQELLYNIEPTTNNNFIVQGYSIDSATNDTEIILYKIDSAGNLIWAKQCGDSTNVNGGSNQVSAGSGKIFVEPDGEIINTFTTQWYGMQPDAVMQRIDSMGNETDAHLFANFGSDVIITLNEDEEGNIIFSAARFVKCDSAFNIIWVKSYPFVPGVSNSHFGSVCQSSVSGFAALTLRTVPTNTFGFFLVDTLGNSNCLQINPDVYTNAPLVVGVIDILNSVTVQNISTTDSSVIFYSAPFPITDSIYCESATGVDENLTELMHLFPNPANNFVTISHSNEKINYFEFTDVFGRKTSPNYTITSKKEITVDVRSLSNGIYFIQLHGNKNNYTVKLIKQ